jgi:transcriptional regulator with XRE-family HTH domain
MMDITHRFGKSVRCLRQKLSLSQEELAEKSALHRTYIGSVERGERNITLINAERIAKALDVDLTELLKDESTRS